ncbi:hypothetical protein HPP92_013299 [Vanilla planifolia]|uniref:Protein kinase domain-containing protein n=1 Tax=Vanilla planifolia TaxID=51239 RepID=A0A835QS10_VANPL|nr:hypothetical protein HPP92_013299 [Vanilla planifolia]
MTKVYKEGNNQIAWGATDPGDVAVLEKIRKGLANPELLKWPNDDDPCGNRWPHIFCSGNRVAQIQVQSMGLRGPLPEDFNKLTELVNLGLQKNKFSGKLPSFSGLSKLQYAFLDENQFDTIPSDFFNGLTSLQVISLSRNPLNKTGWILPIALGDSAQLANLSLVGCNLIGSLPDFLGNMRSLTVLRVTDNMLSGEIPASYGDLPLRVLWLGNQNGKQISGSISVIASMTMLQDALLHHNTFTGTIPSSIGQLISLQRLWLNNNQLVGVIPENITILKQLQSVRLDNNLLVGPIPKTYIANFSFSNNPTCQGTPGLPCAPEVAALLDFLGHVNYPLALAQSWSKNDPCNSWLGVSCSSGKVTTLNLPNFNLNGTISPSLSKLSSIVNINLQNNRLSGTIPTQLTNLQSLRLLNLSSNNLEPPVPKFSDSVSFFVDNNPLITLPGTPASPPIISPPASPPIISPPVSPPIISPPAFPPIISPPAAPPIISPPASPPIISPPASPPIISPPVSPPAGSPTSPPTSSPGTPASPPTHSPPLSPPIGSPPAPPPSSPPSTGASPPTRSPVSPPTSPPVTPSFPPTSSPPTSPPSSSPPTSPPTSPPAPPPTSSPAPPPIASPPASPPTGLPGTPASPPTHLPGIPASPPPASPGRPASPPTGSSPPSPSAGAIPSSASSKPSNSNKLNLLEVIIPVVIGIFIALLLGILIYQNWKKKSQSRRASSSVIIQPGNSLDGDLVKLCVAENNSNLSIANDSLQNSISTSTNESRMIESGNLVISVQVLRNATNNFSHYNELGRGGFGVVYKGKLHDGTMIAVKRMQIAVISNKGFDEFHAEISVLSNVRHRNLVSLLGYSVEGSEKLLVYEYMPHGALSRHLFRWRELGLKPLSWQARLNIALDVSRAMEYLHSLAQEQGYIHRDLKSSNILLDDELRAKVSDFGLVKLVRDGDRSMATRLAGTFGYLAPEYAVTGKITTKADVFSFGVVLLELITGMTVLDEDRSDEKRYLVSWFHDHNWNQTKLKDAIDDHIGASDEETFQSVCKVVELAGHCTAREANQRPEMGHAVNVLSSMVQKWRPGDRESAEKFGIDFGKPLLQMVRAWQDADGNNSSMSIDDSKGSIPCRPVGFAESFTSQDGR